jgi:multiple sugar transport system ATP-binding protein
MNLVQALLERSDGAIVARVGEQEVEVPRELVGSRPALERYVGRSVLLGIRPEHFEDARLDSNAGPEQRITTTSELTEPLGAEVLVHFTVSARGHVAGIDAENASDADVRLGSDGSEGDVTRMVARVDPETRISVNDRIELAVDTNRIYFFDPETRDAI